MPNDLPVLGSYYVFTFLPGFQPDLKEINTTLEQDSYDSKYICIYNMNMNALVSLRFCLRVDLLLGFIV